MPRFTDRLKHAWSAFFGRDAPVRYDYGPSSSIRPDLVKLSRGNSRSIVTAVYNKISIDCASVPIKHVRLDEADRFKEVIPSGLNDCLSVEANIDQTGRAFLQDVYLSLLDEGVVAIVPVETDVSPLSSGGFDIKELRTGKVIEWMPRHVKVECYNEKSGKKEIITLPKKMVALPENPFRSVMNEPNSTLQRLQRKLVLLDMIDERTASSNLNLIVQVPYSSRRELDKKRAEQRREDIENQLTNSKLGIAYMDGTEKVVQLNKPLENNLLEQIEALRKEFFNQLGLTEEVFNGTANEEQNLNYNNGTLEPLISSVVDEMRRKFLTKTARTQRQSIMFFREPFRLVPVAELAKIADVFTRNEILSSNEFRAILGFKPADSERANELINKNMPVEDVGTPALAPDSEVPEYGDSPRPDIMSTPISALGDPMEEY